MSLLQLGNSFVWLPWVVVLLFVALIVVIGLTIFQLRRRGQATEQQSDSDKQPPPTDDDRQDSRGLGRELSARLRNLKSHIAFLTGTQDGIGRVPWMALIHAGVDGSTDSVRSILGSLDTASQEAAMPQLQPGTACRFHVALPGVFVELDADTLARNDWLQRWERVVRAIITFRHQRPVDGVVVTIPASDLLDSTPASINRLTDRGDQLHQMLWSLQRLTGLRVPVYLLITHCEGLKGFRRLVEALPPDARDQILGWSVPFSLDTAFQSIWIDEGFKAASQSLERIQTHVLMAASQKDDQPQERADQVFLFASEISNLAQPTKAFLSSVFRSSAYQESFLFRGFYLTGETAATDIDCTAGEQQTPPTQAVFVLRLFADKVLRETHLARPAWGAFTRRQRDIQRAQIGLGALGIAASVGLLYISTERMRVESARQLMSVLQTEIQRVAEVSNDRSVQKGAEFGASFQGFGMSFQGTERNAELRVAARNLLQSMSRVTIDGVETMAAPTSLMTSANLSLEQAIAYGFDTIVLKVILHNLREKFQSILVQEKRILSEDYSSVVNQSILKNNFEEMVDELSRFDHFYQVYQSLRETKNISDLASLCEYALGVTLPPSFFENYYLYEEGLNLIQSTKIDHDFFNQSAEEGVEYYVKDTFENLYSNTPLRELGQSLNEQIEALASQETHRSKLTAIHSTLFEMEAVLASGRYQWLNDGAAEFDPAIEDGIARIAQLSFLTPEFATSLRQRGHQQMAAGRRALTTMRGLSNTPILAHTGSHWQLSEHHNAALSVLEDLFSQPLASIEPGKSQHSAAPSMPIIWDTQALNEVRVFMEALTVNTTDHFSVLSYDIRRSIRAIQEEMIVDYIDSKVIEPAVLINRRTFGAYSSRSELYNEVSNFSVASPLLAGLRDGLTVLGFSKASARITSIADAQVARLLQNTDALLNRARPYEPQDHGFSDWDGHASISPAAFGVSSVADLGVFLSFRREFIERLARDYAQPLLSYQKNEGLESPAYNNSTSAKWLLIVDALDKYQIQEPGNSIQLLENFILNGMNVISIENCITSLNAQPSSDDYFGQQLQYLKDDILARCEEISHQRAVASYQEIANDFNQLLAGRFPFVGAFATLDTSNASGVETPGADPNDIRRFFSEHRETMDWFDQGAGSSAAISSLSESAEEFLTQLALSRAALAPLAYDTSIGWPLNYKVDVEFRTNVARELAGNQILEWKLNIGQSEIDSAQAEAKSVVWTIGDPVSLTLRWASMSPMLPLEEADNGPDVIGLQAVFSYNDPWSLFSLIADNTPSFGEGLALPDRRPEIIRLDIPLRPNPEAANGGGELAETAVVYMRVGLTAIVRGGEQPEQQIGVKLPIFPAAAPNLSQRYWWGTEDMLGNRN